MGGETTLDDWKTNCVDCGTPFLVTVGGTADPTKANRFDVIRCKTCRGKRINNPRKNKKLKKARLKAAAG